MINIMIKITFLLMVGVFVSACTNTKAHLVNMLQSPQATPQQEVCVKLKREMLYHSQSRNTEAVWVTKEQQTEYERRLKESKCQ